MLYWLDIYTCISFAHKLKADPDMPDTPITINYSIQELISRTLYVILRSSLFIIIMVIIIAIQ